MQGFPEQTSRIHCQYGYFSLGTLSIETLSLSIYFRQVEMFYLWFPLKWGEGASTSGMIKRLILLTFLKKSYYIMIQDSYFIYISQLFC